MNCLKNILLIIKVQARCIMLWATQKAHKKKHNIQVNLIKSGLINLKKDIGNASKDDVNKIEEMNKIADIVELILYFNNDD